jgi:signal transduction histidine kinase
MEAETKLLKLTSGLSGNYIEVKISDTGKGIAQEIIKNIFDPMVTSKVYGPGLGLTFALKIFQEHEGTINAESEEDKGTTFTITFPVEKS